MRYEAVIGLEVHAQLRTQTKIFCACPTAFGAPPNRHICPVCTGQPGALPVLNAAAVEFAIRAGLATHCRIAPTSVFARKNYFYPDLPKGYQISQYDRPLCEAGYLDIPVVDSNSRTCGVEGGVSGQTGSSGARQTGNASITSPVEGATRLPAGSVEGAPGIATKRVSIIRIHLEEDAGKLLHDFGHTDMSHVDLNRAGVPLIEIVSGPDLRSAKEAIAYLKHLRSILMYLEICDGNMQEGSLRCDANVSVRPAGSTAFGTRAELKNLNSFRFLERAIAFEIDRQTTVIEDGGTVVQETRLWNEARNISESMRSKEEAHDYRYFPDPDLLPLTVTEATVDAIRAHLPELAEQKATRFADVYGLSTYDARLLTAEKPLATFFETACASYKVTQDAGRSTQDEKTYPKRISNWILTELLGKLNTEDHDITECRIAPATLARLVALIDNGTISGKMAKDLFEEMYASGAQPDDIVKTRGLAQVSDTDLLATMIDAVIAEQPANVAAYRAGKIQLIGFFVGEVMKKTKGQANPKVVNELLRKKLA